MVPHVKGPRMRQALKSELTLMGCAAIKDVCGGARASSPGSVAMAPWKVQRGSGWRESKFNPSLFRNATTMLMAAVNCI
jgi:hypothetical protein